MNDGQNGLIPRESIQDIHGWIPTMIVLYAIKYFELCASVCYLGDHKLDTGAVCIRHTGI
jgi:hypothetical protein